MITKQVFDKLLEVKQENCVSIYIPTYRIGHVQEDKLRFKNAVNNAQKQLEQKGMEEKASYQLLRPAFDLLEQEDFWLHLSDGLAVFIADNFFEKYTVPVDFNTLIFTGKSFHLRPLLPLFSNESRFFLLALSQNEVRFFEGTQYSITPVIIDDLVPGNLEEVLQNEGDKSTLQAHSSGDASSTPIFHGQGMGKDHKMKELRTYFRHIDDGLMEMLHDEKAPLILATVDYMAPLYREITRYIHMYDLHINGNPENDDPVLLHEKAWNILKDHFNRNENRLKEEFGSFLNEGKASTNINDILIAAKNGKVDNLFIDKDKRLWGRFNPENFSVEVVDDQEPKSIDLLDLAAIETYKNGGTVYQKESEELPYEKSEANAIYRY